MQLLKNIMNWVKRFTGMNDKQQAARTEEVAEYVHTQKNLYTKEMLKIQRQAKKVHEKTRQAHAESVKLKEVVDDVTKRIAIATGGV